MPWRTIANEHDRPALEFELEKVVRGFFRPDLFLDYIRYFVLFEADGDALIKKIAGYHQFHGVREAVRVTLIALATEASARSRKCGRRMAGRSCPARARRASSGTRRARAKASRCAATRGSSCSSRRSLTLRFIEVPDRLHDLDGQLYQQFCAAKDLLKQTPEQAESREQLREMLAARQSGGIIFTTTQNFSPGKILRLPDLVAFSSGN